MTIAGAHTVTELSDLVNAKDYVIGQIQHGYDAFESTWKAQDQPAQSKWLSDWNLLRSRYGRAHVLADIEIANAKIQPVPSDIIPAETAYTAILRSLQKTEGTVSQGDLQDLYQRLADAQGKGLSFPSLPQPQKGSDVDLNTLNQLQGVDPIRYVQDNPKKSIIGAIALAAAGLIGYDAYTHRRR